MENSILFCSMQDKISTIKRTLSIILIAHVQQPRGHINNSQLQCSNTERFSIEEFNEIYQGIVGAGFYIQAVYFNEIDFISDFLEHSEKFKNCLVYNLARNGSGNNKKTVIPAFCELVGLSYSTSGSLSCAFCRNKYYFSKLLNLHDIPAPQSWLYADGVWMGGQMPSNGTRVIYKPCSESASQGIDSSSVFHFTMEQLNHLKEKNYLIQEYVDGEECEVPVLSIDETVTALHPVGIDLYGRNILYEKESSEYNYGFYSLLETQEEATIELIEKYAIQAFKLLQMEVYGRIDFRIDSKGNPYIIDVATTPYTIKHSSFAFAFEQLGLSYNYIYETIISSALSRSDILKRQEL